jgi:lipopolysaccharide biosynthesis glycosyltransferase
MKYLYVLVSDEKDYYLEQALLSITSLKMWIPDGFVSLLIDDATEKTLIDKRRNILELINELKIVKVDDEFNKTARSRWLKTAMRQHIEGDFLYIDCDTIITGDLSEVSQTDYKLAAVLDKHVLIADHHFNKYIKERDKKLGFNTSEKTNKHFNSGVIYCKDCSETHNFFNKWNKLWHISKNKNIIIDQPAFNEANIICDNLIHEINGIWNCQISNGGLNYLGEAKIIHYFSSAKECIDVFSILSNKTMLEIKQNYIWSDAILEKIKNIRSDFSVDARIITNRQFIEIIDSVLFRFLLRRKNVFRVFNRLITNIRTICRI